MRALSEIANRTPGIKGMPLKVGAGHGSRGTLEIGSNNVLARDMRRLSPEPVRRHSHVRNGGGSMQSIDLVDKGRPGSIASRTAIRDGMFAGLVIGSLGKQFETKRAPRPRKKSLKDQMNEVRKAFKKFMKNPAARLPKRIATLVKAMSKSRLLKRWLSREIGKGQLTSTQLRETSR